MSTYHWNVKRYFPPIECDKMTIRTDSKGQLVVDFYSHGHLFVRYTANVSLRAGEEFIINDMKATFDILEDR